MAVPASEGGCSGPPRASRPRGRADRLAPASVAGHERARGRRTLEGGALLLRLVPGADGEARVFAPFVPGAIVDSDVVATEEPERIERHGAGHPTIAIDDDFARKMGDVNAGLSEDAR